MGKKTLSSSTPSYYEYLDICKNKTLANKLKDYDNYLKKYPFFNGLMSAIPCAIYVLDFTEQRYLYANENSKHITGRDVKEILEKGLQAHMQYIHPDDMQQFNSRAFKQTLDFLKKLTIDEVKDCRFSVNYRYLRKDGKYVNLLQQYVYLEADEEKNPLLTMGILIDISAYKTDSKMVFTIARFDEVKGFIKVSSESFATANISAREEEVLQLIAYGFGSKQIAEKLFISQFTVKTHRRNLLEKTKCKNSAELVNYAHNMGLA